MKKLLIVLSLITLNQLIGTSQRSRNKGKIIKATTGIQFAYVPTEYSFTPFLWNSFDLDVLDLTFLTFRSGTFEVMDGQIRSYKYEGQFNPTSFHIGAGFGIQIVNGKENFHEISLTRLSFNESNTKALIEISDGAEVIDMLNLGANEKSFSIGFRYQIGRYLGDPANTTRFGIAAILDPVYNQYNRMYYSTTNFPVKSRILNLHVGISPMLNFELSNNVSLTTKLFPQLRIPIIEKVKEQNPFVPPMQQFASTESKGFSLSGAITLEYVLKAPRRRRK